MSGMVTAAVVNAGVKMATDDSGGGSLDIISNFNAGQKAVWMMLVADAMGVDPSTLAAHKGSYQALLKSGALDGLVRMTADDPRIAERVFQGDRVADLTPTQRSIIDAALGDSYQFQNYAKSKAHLDETGEVKSFFHESPDITPIEWDEDQRMTVTDPSEVQVVGEDGPETINPTEDIEIIPADEVNDVEAAIKRQADVNKEQIRRRETSRAIRKEKKLENQTAEARRKEARLMDRIERFTENDKPNKLAKAEGKLARLRDKYGFEAPTVDSEVETPTIDSAVGTPAVDSAVGTLPISSDPPIEDAIDEGVAYTQPMTPSPNTDPDQYAIESDLVGGDAEELIADTGYVPRADGGFLNEGEKAVVGEKGPELAVPRGSLDSSIAGATQRALSGKPAATVNSATTSNLINQSIVNPLNRQFKENTLPSIGASVAGAGFSGSQRVKATQRATDQLQNTIADKSAKLRYDDEQARRDLATDAADRSAKSIQTGLDVQNRDVTRRGLEANVASTEAGTASTEFNTRRGKSLLATDIESAETAIETALKGLDFTDASIARLGQLAEREILEQDKLSKETEHRFKAGGMADKELDELVQTIKKSKQDELIKDGEAIAKDIENRRAHYDYLLDTAQIEQLQNQDELWGDMEYIRDRNTFIDTSYNNLTSLVDKNTQTSVATPD
tara:strand:- start:13802 stop:15829 length:2028 start_codon:yes stop_codon:yes gene_type:complete